MPDVISDQLRNMFDSAMGFAWVIAVAVAFVWISRKVRGRVSGVVVKRGGDQNLVVIIDNLIRITIYLIVGLLIVGALTGDTSASVTAIGLITAAVSLSLQDVLRNFVSGLYLLMERPFKVGDTIRLQDQSGKVERVDIRTTVIRNEYREEVFIPNFTVFSQIVRRQTSFEPRKYQITSPYPVTESYDAIWNAAMSVQGTQQRQQPTVQISGADAENVEFDVTLWDPAGTTRSDAFIAAVKASLEKAKVTYKAG